MKKNVSEVREMFGNYHDIQNLQYRSVNGVMCKSHPKSIICEVGRDSPLLDRMCPREKYSTLDKEQRVVVLQVMNLGNGFIVEYVPKSLWETEVESNKYEDDYLDTKKKQEAFLKEFKNRRKIEDCQI